MPDKKEIEIRLCDSTDIVEKANEQRVRIFLNKYSDKLSQRFRDKLLQRFKNSNICEYSDLFDAVLSNAKPFDFEEIEFVFEMTLMSIVPKDKVTIWKILV